MKRETITDMLRTYVMTRAHGRILQLKADNCNEKQKESPFYPIMLHEIQEAEIECKQVEAWLDLLPEEKAFILRQKYIERYSWTKIARVYAEKYKIDYSPDTIRRKAKRAIEVIAKWEE